MAAVRHRQGRLLGEMKGIGFRLQEEAVLRTLTQDVVKSSEIEGEILDEAQVRSSIGRRLGMDIGAAPTVDRNVDRLIAIEQRRFAEGRAGWEVAMPTAVGVRRRSSA